MECGYKRKLDCIVDSMEVISAPDTMPLLNFSHRNIENETKKMRFSMQQLENGMITSEQFQAFRNHQLSEMENMDKNEWSQSSDNSVNHRPVINGDMNFDNTDTQSLTNDHCSREDDMYEDLPSTAEVINSLRKVILWMSAQVDHNADYIQYLGEVERYAVSKQLDIAQQRKITSYFIKQDQQ